MANTTERSDLVSIIIPCYNAEEYVSEAIESALSQTYEPKEIVIVDDGSTDGSLAIARSFETQGVTVISQKNKGASVARNRALSVSSGGYVQYLDADDLLSPNKIELQVQLLKGYPPGYLAVCDTVHFFDGEDSEVLASGWPMIDSDNPVDWLINLLGPDGQGGMVAAHSWLTPRKVVEEAGPWDEDLALGQDGEYFARVVLSSSGIRRADGALTYYRKYRSKNSVSGRQTRAAHLSALRANKSIGQRVLSCADKINEVRVKRALARRYEKRAFLAYPAFPEISATAERRAKRLGGGSFTPMQHSRKARLAYRLFGWKASRRIQYWYRRLLNNAS